MKARPLSAINLIVLHHSASPPNTPLETVRSWHQDKNGWDDIGYHFYINSEGIHAGRRIDLVGAHCRGFNQQSIGICVAGDNTKTAYRWGPQQREWLRELVQWIRVFMAADLPMARHLDLAETLCPGIRDKAWDELKTFLGVNQYERRT